jgi:hypothetical protein
MAVAREHFKPEFLNRLDDVASSTRWAPRSWLVQSAIGDTMARAPLSGEVRDGDEVVDRAPDSAGLVLRLAAPMGKTI